MELGRVEQVTLSRIAGLLQQEGHVMGVPIESDLIQFLGE